MGATLHAGLVRAEEPWILSVEAAAGGAVTEPQRTTFGPGVSGSVALLRPLLPWLVVGARARYVALFAGEAFADPGRVQPGTGSLLSGTLGLRIRPLAARRQDLRRSVGPWIEAAAGGGITGDLWRPTAELGLGWGVALGPVTLSPTLRYVHVFQPSDPIDGRDARLLLGGIELAFFDARRAPVVEAAPEPVPEPEPEPEPEPQEPSDRDMDGIPDHLDACPDEPEDFDGFQDEDGCPDPDNDGDGIPDVVDACPNEPETINGIEDEDGCPDEGLIELVDDRIVLEERVLFDFQRARVRSAARPVLDAIVHLWRQHPEWTRLRVEGHADVRGPSAYNLKLSRRRARNVMEALIRAGIPREIIAFEGHGETVPRDRRSSEEAHERNRRVEFVVVQDDPVEAAEAHAPQESGEVAP
jgi:outer membrane protein OmpA-like peptidoglycan-associated protein